MFYVLLITNALIRLCAATFLVSCKSGYIHLQTCGKDIISRSLLFQIHSHQVGLLLSISNSYTMGCPHVRGDNPRSLASRLSYVQVDKHGITNLYHYISVHLAHHEIFHALFG